MGSKESNQTNKQTKSNLGLKFSNLASWFSNLGFKFKLRFKGLMYTWLAIDWYACTEPLVVMSHA